jgi:hypothetical protein
MSRNRYHNGSRNAGFLVGMTRQIGWRVVVSPMTILADFHNFTTPHLRDFDLYVWVAAKVVAVLNGKAIA